MACRGPSVDKKDAEIQTKDWHILSSAQAWIDGQYASQLSSTSDIQQQIQQVPGKKCGHGKTTDGKGVKQSRKENDKDKENIEDPKKQESEQTL